FESGMIEDLDAVVLIRIVRSRDHDAGSERSGLGRVGQPRRADQTGVARAYPALGKPARHVSRDPWSGLARVHADHDFGIQVMRADPLRPGYAHGKRCRTVQGILARRSADAIRSK